MRIEQLMTRSPVTCEPDDALSLAAQKMFGCDCGCLPVIAGDGSRRLVGMVTDRDICMAARFQERSLQDLRVRDAMSKEVRACNPGDSIVEAEAIMQEARVRRLPVVDESEQIIGVISLADLAREAAWERVSEMPRITTAEIGFMLATLCEPRDAGEKAVANENNAMVGC